MVSHCDDLLLFLEFLRNVDCATQEGTSQPFGVRFGELVLETDSVISDCEVRCKKPPGRM